MEYDVFAAEECTQDVFALLVEKQNILNLDRNIRGWLHAAADRICKDYRKKNAKRMTQLVSDPAAYEQIPDERQFPDAESIFDVLTEEEYHLLEAYYSEEYGCRGKLAATLGMSQRQLSKRIIAIRKKLKNAQNDTPD